MDGKGQAHQSSEVFDYAGEPCKSKIRIPDESEVYLGTCFQALKMLNAGIHLL